MIALSSRAYVLNWYGSRIAIIGYGLLCLHILLFGVLALANPQLYNALTYEDQLVENLTAVWYLLASVLLFVVARNEQRGIARGIYIMVGIALVFIAGEEISWGQRIIGFATPDYLLDTNVQEEFNFHNISNRFVSFIAMFYHKGRLALCVITITALFCGRDRLLGIPLPSLPLVLGFLAADAYLKQHSLFIWPAFILQETNMPLLFLGSYALISRQYKLLLIVAVAALVIAVNAYVISQTILTLTYPAEVTEYLISVTYVWYAVELLMSQRRAAMLPGCKQIGVKLSAAICPRRLAIKLCAIVIVASIGLMLIAYSRNVFPEAHFAYIYGADAPFDDTEPTVRANFDIYIQDGRIYYYKESCTQEDVADLFFLHIIPVQEDDLVESWRPHGFENLDFPFEGRGVLLGEKCAAHIELPSYPIALIRTGQYIQNGGRLWEVEFAPPSP